MSNNKINLIANTILPFVAIGLTAILFVMFRPENPTALFYINMGYTIALEAVFFGYLNPTCHSSSYKYFILSKLGLSNFIYGGLRLFSSSLDLAV